MTDTAVRLPATRYLSDVALLADLHEVRKQLTYAGALSTSGDIVPGSAPARLATTWEALNAEAVSRGLPS